MQTIQQAVHDAKQQLTDAGLLDSPQLDAELLLAESLQKDRTYLFTWPENTLTADQSSTFQALLKQRLAGHPMAHILGYREFWGLKLKVTADTLIPRPDTETLIETVLNLPLSREAKLLDMGTGSGAIALALKSEFPQYQVAALDKSPAALQVAQKNASDLNLEISFYESDWFSAVQDLTFDCIVSNPPYIETEDPHLSLGDVRFEPRSALTSGEDGLEDIRLIIDQAWNHLNTHGWLVIEHGYNQADALAELLQAKGYRDCQSMTDYGANPRVSLGRKPE